MKKIFTNIPLVIVLGLITGTSIYFYNQNDFFNKQERCAVLGKSYLKEEEINWNYSRGSASNYIDSPKFAYSRKYNNCFYLNSSHFASGSEIAKNEYYIINLNTNEKVASYTSWDKGYDDYSKNMVYLESKIQFDKMNKEIFVKINE